MTCTTATDHAVALEDRIGYRFTDHSLLDTALTHSSWCAENVGTPSNQRLEFLGDAVLGLVIAHRLYCEPGDLTEGQMSKARASMVNKAALAESGSSLGLGMTLRLGRGEDTSGGRDNPSLLADALEALIGAVYLDGGLTAADAMMHRLMDRVLCAAVSAPDGSDFKTRLQEMAARIGVGPPRYDTTASGPDHDRRFRVSVSAGQVVSLGEGSTKKGASQRAAEAAYRALSDRLAREQA